MSTIYHNRRLFVQTATAACLGTVISGCGQGDRVPDFKVVLLDGSTVDRESLIGKVTLVNFWATTCVTCVQEMPELVRLHQSFHGRGFETLAVAMSYDPPAYVASFAETRKLPFKVGLDLRGDVAKQWGDIRLTPTSFLVDRAGGIVKRYVGAPEFVALASLVDKLLTG